MINSPSPFNNVPTNGKSWYDIARKIRNQNDKLKQKISDLEHLVAEQQEQIKIQDLKNQNYEELFAEQEEVKLALASEINRYKEQIAQQEEQIEIQHENISNLIQELEKIQQQTARLERECSLLQESYNEGENKLKQIEAENKDLRIRLQRQQRYNLQYKAALDQSLNNSTISHRDSNGLGIKSWADNETGNDATNTSNDNLDLNLGEAIDFWHNSEPSTADFREQTNQNNSVSEPKTNESEIKPQPIKPEDRKNRQKLFIKLPQFGTNKN